MDNDLEAAKRSQLKRFLLVIAGAVIVLTLVVIVFSTRKSAPPPAPVPVEESKKEDIVVPTDLEIVSLEQEVASYSAVLLKTSLKDPVNDFPSVEVNMSFDR